MSHPTTPHTQTQQNLPPDQSDFDPDQSANSSELRNLSQNQTGENAQSGTNRAPEKIGGSAHYLNTEPSGAAMEGSVTTRTPAGSAQGISNRSANEERPRQRKVVDEREDAQEGVNHNR